MMLAMVVNSVVINKFLWRKIENSCITIVCVLLKKSVTFLRKNLSNVGIRKNRDADTQLRALPVEQYGLTITTLRYGPF